MKKTNFHNILIIAIIFSFFYILNVILTQNNIDITFKIDISNGYKILVIISLYLFLMGSIILYASKTVFNLYIKHDRTTKLINSRYYLVIASIFTSYIFLLFEVETFYYFGSIILLYIIYFGSLYFYDLRYVEKQQKIKVDINNDVVTNFLVLLGGKDNIISVSYEHSRLKVELKNINIVNVEGIKELGASGIFIAGNKLQAIIGSN